MELYLDSAATTNINKEVLDEYVSLLNTYYGSTGSLHSLGVKSLEMETKARDKIASLLRVRPNEILFTTGATEGNNYAIKGVALNYQKRGKTLITTKIEHPSVIESFKQLQEDFGFNVIYLDVDNNGLVSLDSLKKALNNDVILVSIMYVNHEIGTIQPIKEIRKILDNYPKVIFHSDITQAIGKTNVDLSLVDIATMSSHKIHGLKGQGLMYKKEKINLYPLISGKPVRNGLRAGTSDFIGHIVLAKTLEIALNELKISAAPTLKIKEKVIEELNKIDEVVVNSTLNNSIPNTINFSLPSYNSEVIIRAMSLKGVYLSSRSVCSLADNDSMSMTLHAMGKDDNIATSSIRISFDSSFDDDKINYFITSLKEVIKETKRR